MQGLAYRAPQGPMGQAVARLLSPAVRLQLHEDLRRFKRMLEAGEIATTEAQTSHRIGLDEVPEAYRTLRDKEDGCVKVVIRPNGGA